MMLQMLQLQQTNLETSNATLAPQEEVESKDEINSHTDSESFNATIVTIEKLEPTLVVSNDALVTYSH